MVSKSIYNSREEWLQARTSFIGGSDASCILGLNPYKSNIDLYEEKLGTKEKENVNDNEFVKYGTDAEKYLRELFKLDFPKYEVDYEEHNMWTNDKYPFAHASLDGYLTEKSTGRKGILEIKTANIVNSSSWEKWKDKIPNNYYIQVLHYLAVTEFDFVVLKAQLKHTTNDTVSLTTRHYLIERKDVEADIEYLMQKEKEFADCIINKTKPTLLIGW